MAPPSTPRRPTAKAASSPLATPSSSKTPSTLHQDMDDPTATPSAYIRSNTAAAAASHAVDDSDGEDEAPDYLRLLSTLNPKSKAASAATAGDIVIPKRGEKDFEPTGFGGQAKLLERSREAMFHAVSGERRVGSRSLVRATWDASTARARLLDVQGKIFETVGVIRREQVHDAKTGKMVTKAWNELLPEEALFLAERGSLQIYDQCSDDASTEQDLAPMSLQQAFAELMKPPSPDSPVQDEPLTREAYLIYAYLKRLGYVVQRASLVDAVRAAPISASALAKKNNSQAQPFAAADKAAAEGIIADPQRPIKLTTIWDILLYIPRRMVQLAGDGVRALVKRVRWMWERTVGRLIAMISAAAGRALGGRTGKRATVGNLGLGLSVQQDGRRFLGHKGAVEWDSYDAVFTSLQIVPSGHDFWLPSDAPSAASASETIQHSPESQPRPTNDSLQPFYYAWRPATLYRKSHPPPPEFRIVILNARTTPVPSVWQFESIFARIPIPGSDAELFGAASAAASADDAEGKGMTEEQVRERVEYEKKLKASNEAKNRAAYGKFSEGKQKHLREKAAARQATAAQRREAQLQSSSVTTRIAALLKRFSDTAVGKALLKVALLDFVLLRAVATLFRHCPPGCWSDARRSNKNGGAGRFKGRNAAGGSGAGRGGVGNPFPPLKAGRRTVVVAVVDGSITTLLRFGESEFAQWALYGTAPLPTAAPATVKDASTAAHK
ncbi:uncharacterized protein SRS1_15590 [Sporisorium reilianum f. sp. reilianum]|uniref:tRNA-splicing endonuclease subunit Sen54 N-terminal domain-containing protein n=1 Tax=Sporisorium reilianum f. sp. reilianum TaxID=72559 RepID=A0A2N8UKI9_9BASI|nr:uncharacterized protein SRS1_15590 [Sporisorium reilianum f. sp. reilianum]